MFLRCFLHSDSPPLCTLPALGNGGDGLWVTANSPLAALRLSDVDKSALLTRDSVTRLWHILVKRDNNG